LPFGLKAEPGADAALPGVFGADALPQDWFGWPSAFPDCVCIVGALVGELIGELMGAVTGRIGGPMPGLAAAAVLSAHTAAIATLLMKRFIACSSVASVPPSAWRPVAGCRHPRTGRA
jgi:hypothetical protein